MIRQGTRLRLVLSLLLVVFGLLASYALLRGASGISAAAPKTASATTPNAAPAPAGISQSPAPDHSVPERPIAKQRARKGPGTPKQSSVKFVPARTSDSNINTSIDSAVLTANLTAPKDTLLALGPTDPLSLNKVVPSKLRALPLPQGGSGSPPNPPTLSSPANGGTGVSTSPTLKVNVSDPNSNNVTVNFYGKVIPSGVPGPSFTIVALPDTQYYSSSQNGGTMAMFNSQTQWAVDNVATNNIALVIGLGDIVQDGNLNGNFFEWANADSAVSLLDNPATTGLPQGIPYSFGVGNHDQGPNGNGGQPNDTAGYNQYFGISRYSGKSYYGGHYGTQNDNHYELFSAGGMDFIVISLAYDVSADPNVLAWANGLLQTYSNRRGIVVSHYLINDGFNATWSPQGQATYNALRGNPNLFLMLAGHWTPPEGQRTDVFNGNRVFTLMSDYQDSGGGGDGWMRILTFSPANNQIQVQTYSPFLDQSETTSSGQFTINYDMQGNGNNFALLASKTGVLSGTSTSFTWPGLSPGSSYEWYVTVSKSTGTAVGPLWSFTTSGSSPVTLSPSSLSFPSQPVNTTSGSKTVILTNTGSATLNISSITASSNYSQTNTCGASVAPGGSCNIAVTFRPTVLGTDNGTVTVSDNASGGSQTITLTGSGVAMAPVASLSTTSLTFGSQAVGTPSASQNVTLTNLGNTSLSITSVAVSGDYAATTCPSSLAINASCTINVTFTPTTTGTRSGAITITDNAGGSPQVVTLTGTGTSSGPPPATTTFGKTTAGNQTDTADSNSVIAGRFQSGTLGGTALSISVHAGAIVSAAPNNLFQAALYSDNAGKPGTLIASSSSATLIASSWNTVAISATISPSTWYWIAYNTNGTSASANNLTLSSGSIANQTQWISTEPFGTWPTTYGPVGGTTADQWDMYVTKTP
jgi:hypothetical protein